MQETHNDRDSRRCNLLIKCNHHIKIAIRLIKYNSKII